MRMDEIDYGAVAHAVDDVADSPAGDGADRRGDNGAFGPAQPEAERGDNRQRYRGENDMPPPRPFSKPNVTPVFLTQVRFSTGSKTICCRSGRSSTCITHHLLA